jgi:hypothetical protein
VVLKGGKETEEMNKIRVSKSYRYMVFLEIPQYALTCTIEFQDTRLAHRFLIKTSKIISHINFKIIALKVKPKLGI